MSRGWRWILYDEYRGPPLSAPAWLDIAVRGLAPPAAERVRAEHLAHLEDALASGETEPEVVAGWGDPWAAWRKLRRVHPTQFEAGLLPPPYPPGLRGLRESLERDLFVPLTFGVGLSVMLALDVAQGRPGSAYGVLGAGVLLAAPPLGLLRWLLLRGPRSPAQTAALHWLLGPLGALAVAMAGTEAVRHVNGDGTSDSLFLVGLPLLALAALSAKAAAVARKVADSQS